MVFALTLCSFFGLEALASFLRLVSPPQILILRDLWFSIIMSPAGGTLQLGHEATQSFITPFLIINSPVSTASPFFQRQRQLSKAFV